MKNMLLINDSYISLINIKLLADHTNTTKIKVNLAPFEDKIKKLLTGELWEEHNGRYMESSLEYDIDSDILSYWLEQPGRSHSTTVFTSELKMTASSYKEVFTSLYWESVSKTKDEELTRIAISAVNNKLYHD